MKPLTSHNYNLEELSELRTYNSKTFRTLGTKEHWFFNSFSYKRIVKYSGNLLTEFHIKPIHYVSSDLQWKDLNEVSSYFGNRNGMTLISGWEKKINFGYLIWYLKRQKLIRGSGIRLYYPSTYIGKNINSLELPLLLNTESTFNPDANVETTSVDGLAQRHDVDEVFSTIRNGAGTYAADADISEIHFRVLASTTTNQYAAITRSFLLFDTSSIPDNDTIDSAVLSVFGGTPLTSTFGGTVKVDTVSPASNTALVAADYNIANHGMVSQSDTTLNIASWNTAAFNDLTLNATGRGNVSKTGISKFGMKTSFDMDNTAPTWSSADASRVNGNFAESANDPKLVVNHSAAVVGMNLMPLLGVG